MLGDNIRRMRSYSNITKTRLALMVKIGRPLLNRIENGTADIRLSVIAKLADSLATTPDFLLTKHSDEDIRAEIEQREVSAPAPAMRHARLY
ncbi:helix-turn-helix domain-containing protein [Eggerthella sp. HF-4214]|uniref:Helix-turn-helix domain-containing protein n=1 Tax=Eggerthella guodeyinii TaxID=2690837 RepID=A0A6N7RLR6_9ACTN|nr:helix-turn-helix domain-containing protein [Eggerthella guodeyinii]